MRAVKAVMVSDVVQHAPPAVRGWLFAILARGEGASRTDKVAGRPAIRTGISGSSSTNSLLNHISKN